MKTIIIVTALLIWLPIDLFLLYYAGGWREPNPFILNTELTVLYSTPLFAIWVLYRYIREERRR